MSQIKLDRRQFISAASLGLASAALAGCAKRPIEKIIPYIYTPENILPGHPQFFTTSYSIGGVNQGLLISTEMAKPIKVDGNPLHPTTRGRSLSIHQALLFDLFDESRLKHISRSGHASTREELEQEFSQISRDEVTVFLTEVCNSPVLEKQFLDLKQRYPKLEWVQFEPVSHEKSLNASEKVFGKRFSANYALKKAQVVVSFGADPFASPLYPVSLTSDLFEKRRDDLAAKRTPTQVFVLESTPSLIGNWAQHRMTCDRNKIDMLVHQLIEGGDDPFVKQMRAAIAQHEGICIFLAGPGQSEYVHEATHYLNSINGRQVIQYRAASTPRRDLDWLKDTAVDNLVIVGGDPARYIAFARDVIKKTKRSFRFSLRADATSQLCQWSVPLQHAFEFWSDAINTDGSFSIQQPIVRPTNGLTNIHEIFSLFKVKDTKQLVQSQHGDMTKMLETGFAANASSSNLPRANKPSPKKREEGAYDLCFLPDPNLWDGRYDTNIFLQELPKPFTQLTWGSAALISKDLAKAHSLKDGQVVIIKTASGQCKIPVIVVPGQAAKTITIYFGSNHDSLWNGFDIQNAEIIPTQEFEKLATTQSHHELEKSVKVDGDVKSLYPSPPVQTAKEAWAMVIDLDSCIGCNACTIACQVENNIPVVGKAGVLMGREMHWIRVDNYYADDKISFRPVPCMHCEKAPCEEVCPTAATVHSTDGLNQMVYNRCIGTRYCANNCPYKVRRFNYFNFSAEIKTPAPQNPDVSIRPRGVIEKCTYCTQRITRARIEAEKTQRDIYDGEVQTACQTVCPSKAITFGDQNDIHSEVAKLKKNSRHYVLLEELGTRPRTTYLRKENA